MRRRCPASRTLRVSECLLEEMSLASKFPLAIAMTEITMANADQRFAFGLGLQIEGLKAVLHSS
ncbi:TetR/AcrR family transcriptional regulator C-terminal domain-containing protein [Rhizobium leguminosarum]|uniref:TetR/AcrR family transcriptional regulator C-terminal domain-containing protein n=1 Tax=Rhizobium leguminosarum TaxID=384 RepID=UPI001C9224FA